jgi:hypothetical protein
MFGPSAVGKLMADKVFVEALGDGIKARVGTYAASRAIARVVTRLGELAGEGVTGPEDAIFIDPELKKRVDLETGQLQHTVQDVALANRPKVELPPGSQQLDPTRTRLGILAGAGR